MNRKILKKIELFLIGLWTAFMIFQAVSCSVEGDAAFPKRVITKIPAGSENEDIGNPDSDGEETDEDSEEAGETDGSEEKEADSAEKDESEDSETGEEQESGKTDEEAGGTPGETPDAADEEKEGKNPPDLGLDEEEKGTDETEEPDENDEKDENDENGEDFQEPVVREWTVMVYMAADNELEASAISDLNEMENAEISDKISVLALLDRSPKYDSSNDDWSDTRIFKIKKDTAKNKNRIASERLDCDELGLTKDSNVELDMGSEKTLSGFIEFAKNNYPANHYALIIWGHGAGFRNYSIDDTNGSALSLHRLRRGISDGMNGTMLDVIGFDTCFGATLETAYELCRDCNYLAGTPALVPADGWDYTNLFESFSYTKLSPEDFCELALLQYMNQYFDYAYGSFSVLKLSEVEKFVKDFNNFAYNAASQIKTSVDKKMAFNAFENLTVSYMSSSYPCDMYLDVVDMLNSLRATGITSSYLSTDASQKKFVVSSWSKNGSVCSAGIFFAAKRSNGTYETSHPSLYVNGSRNTEVSRFVSDCCNYAPTDKKSGSLLDKLFYMYF